MRWILVLALALAGCVYSVGRPIDPAKVATLKPGLTTAEEAVRLFGEPSHTIVAGDGRMTLMWTYARSQAYGSVSGQSLQLVFRAGVLDASDPAMVVQSAVSAPTAAR